MNSIFILVAVVSACLVCPTVAEEKFFFKPIFIPINLPGTGGGSGSGSGSGSSTSCTCSGPDFISQSLNQQNCYRAAHHSPNMAQDATLNTAAQKYADLLSTNIKAQNCANAGACPAFKHSPEATAGQYGENLALIPGCPQTGCRAADLWYGEIKDYNFSKPGFSGLTGHFTALVWKETTAVGTGKADTTIGGTCYTVVVSNYSPPGNNPATFSSNVLPK